MKLFLYIITDNKDCYTEQWLSLSEAEEERKRGFEVRKKYHEIASDTTEKQDYESEAWSNE